MTVGSGDGVWVRSGLDEVGGLAMNRYLMLTVDLLPGLTLTVRSEVPTTRASPDKSVTSRARIR